MVLIWRSRVQSELPLVGIDGRAGFRAFAFPLVHAEVGGVLGDQVDFLHAGFHQRFDFLEDGFLRARAVLAADLRDDAEGAGVVAALGDLDVGEMVRREADARRRVVRHVLRLERDEIARVVGGGGAFVFGNLGVVLLS